MDQSFQAAVKACLAPRQAVSAAQKVAIKATDFQDEDGVIIGRVSVAGVFDRENERVTEAALKAATWELVSKVGQKAVEVDVNHEKDAIGCDIVGVYYDYGEKAAVVHFRPHDRAHYEAAKAGEISGFSWSGPYQLTEAEA